MTWDGFFKWLEANGVHYSPGDYHFEGRGHWFPQPPDLTQDRVAPRPPPPWIFVFRSQQELARGQILPTVDVMTSFSKPVYGIEDPKQAKAVVEQALQDFDLAAGGEELAPPPERWDPHVEPTHRPQLRPMQEDDRSAVEQAWRERNAHLLRPRTSSSGPVVAPRYVAEETEEEKKWKAEQRKKHYDGITPDDSEISDSCDLGAHERCSGCGCGCHQSMAMPLRVKPFNFPKHCGCGRTFNEKQWSKLELKGHQVIEADDEGPREVLEIKDCPSCKSTLAVEV